MEQLGCYGSLAPLPSAPSLVSERKKESERVGPNLVTPTGAEQRKAAGLFFFTPRTTNHRCHHHPGVPERARPHGKERRAAAGS